MVIFFSKTELEGYILEVSGLAILFYWFIFKNKISDNMHSIINYLGYISIFGIIYYQFLRDNFNQNIFLIRIENKINSAHLITYFPIMLMALWLSLKYRSSIYGCILALSIVAIHETLFSIIFDIQRFSTGNSFNTLMFFSWLPGNFLFAIVLFIFFKYFYSEFCNKKIFNITWLIYLISLIIWASYGFPVSIDTFNTHLITQYYNNTWINFIECITWFEPIIGCFISFYMKNKDFSALKYASFQIKYIWIVFKNKISSI